MMRSKSDVALSGIRQRSPQILLVTALLYVSIVFVFELPSVFRRLSGADGDLRRPLDSKEETLQNFAPARPYRHIVHASSSSYPFVSGLVLHPFNTTDLDVISGLHQSAEHAWDLGRKVLDDLRSASPPSTEDRIRTEESCPHSLSLTGDEVRDRGRVMVLPCGLSLGSHVTVIGRPRRAHEERDPNISIPKGGDEGVMVSQFMMELQGIRAVDGEAPPRILHFNPRLKGDWSGRPVIEQNTCYRMQWSTPLRCDGRKSKKFEETVDGLVKCEEWSHEDDQPNDSNTAWWLNRHAKKHLHDWMYPFVEDKLFVLTLSAGIEGYHVTVNGRHLTSFPYRPGFVLEDATGLALNGDIDVQSIFAASLPTSHPNIFPHETLEFLPQWKASALPNGSVDLFIGIISAGNHFAERMAVRKSWMSSVRKSSNIVARFFVALHGRKEVNVELKKEAEFFGDIVIVPFMDSYDLVVLKTIAICEYGVRTISAKYIMKCDDDTFVRVNIVIDEINKITSDESLYAGNINYHHKSLRSGKWAVTYEEWPEEYYPPYANGPGYIISSDIARFVISEFENHTLKLFKMEDVSMGMWVEQFNVSRPVEYIHSLRFCQFGCIEGYVTAHYQSPRQMMCLWDKLQAGRPHCCNMR